MTLQSLTVERITFRGSVPLSGIFSRSPLEVSQHSPENVVSGGPMNWSVIGEDVGFTLSAVAPILLIAKLHAEKSAESTRNVATATP
jgi:hypothetical protein